MIVFVLSGVDDHDDDQRDRDGIIVVLVDIILMYAINSGIFDANLLERYYYCTRVYYVLLRLVTIYTNKSVGSSLLQCNGLGLGVNFAFTWSR